MKREEVFSSLQEALQGEIELHRALLDVTREETTLLIDNAVDSLIDKTKEMEAIIVHLRKAETDRLCLTDRLAELIGHAAGDLTLSKVIEIAPETFREEFSQQFLEIAGLLEELRAANRSNAMLIRQSLDYVDFNIRLLSGADNEAGTYEAAGKRKEGASSSMLDQRA